uniref:lysozyme n=1 Tax=Siphoviridae sp. ctvv53 TaxID=2826513 RepID=A0A8S5QKJ3_9CAUD|nr:MAG TPA: endolysin [Siphoviridae sp. ctvv53]
MGYSQPDRRTWYANANWEGHVSSPQNADCSSLAAGAVCYGLHDTYGVPWGHPALPEINDYWTGNLRPGLEARGFDEVPWADENLTPDGGFKVGDIVLSAANEGGVGHVIIIVEDGYDPLESEAWIAEDGSIDGYLGDQTGQETRTARYSTHPHTQAGRWTSCHRFNEAKFFQQWPEFAKRQSSGQIKAAAAAAQAPAASPTPAHAHGIDISSHQAGLHVAAIWADFVIVKATEDNDYVNPYTGSQAQATLGAGKRLGFYHFARPGDAAEQAGYFVDAVRGYLGKATLWLDWEANAVPQGPGWAKAFLDSVKSLTGSTPGIYMNGSAVNGYDWSAVASQYPLWYAGGPDYSDYGTSYSDPAVPSVSYWGQPLIHQYTEDGRLPGYSGTLDLNRLRDRAAWDRMVGGDGQASSAAFQPAYGAQLAVDGEYGAATVGKLKSVMGAVGYEEVFAVANLRRFLNQAVPSSSIRQLTGLDRLPEDRGWDAPMVKVFQYLVLAWNKPGVPSGWSFGDWVDGDFGEATVAALQMALNASKDNSFRLWT